MAIYAANENGDWWEITPGQVLYILDTNNLTDKDREIILERYGDIPSDDSWEDVVQEYGEAILSWH